MGKMKNECTRVVVGLVALCAREQNVPHHNRIELLADFEVEAEQPLHV
jgi:hypothetical protein